jgi:hypothetical protein
MLDNFLKLYEKDRPAFDSVEEMLKSVDLYSNTQSTLEELLLNAGLSRLLIDELVTVSSNFPYSGFFLAYWIGLGFRVLVWFCCCNVMTSTKGQCE